MAKAMREKGNFKRAGAGAMLTPNSILERNRFTKKKHIENQERNPRYDRGITGFLRAIYGTTAPVR